MIASYQDPRIVRRRVWLLFLAQCLKTAWLVLTFRWTRLQPDWQMWRHRALIERSRQFDKAWYLAHNPEIAEAGIDPILHYLRQGAANGRNPHPLFDTNWY